ncbi:ABC transporter substrate-binding protein [Pontibacter sp. E15-1]|uniref:ABC transporter substrate-binding protein n=1 Tax=Pontibacter sp. E15-1 TaxID=2919918 RepID=UPI001F4F29E3|nr:ABC transporter substrate-binding protein [Pontibacter sp. E15-1]MCJ8167088.1 ABC transporter substrate-binding protein [Pontibacter sp. E15-1]
MLRKTVYKQVFVVLIGLLIVGAILYRHLYQRGFLEGYYTVGVLINYNELKGNDLEVMQNIIQKRVTILNQQGGILGKEVRVKYLDDGGDPEIAKKVVAETIEDPTLIGYVGSWSSTRSKAVAELVGPARIPFIGGYALTPLFEEYPNMFTAEKGINDVAARFEKFLEDRFRRTAFIGMTGDLYSAALLQKLCDQQLKDTTAHVVMEKWLPEGHLFDQGGVDSLAATLIATKADFLLLSFRSGITSTFIPLLRQAGVQIPIFTALGDLGQVIGQSEGNNLGELYDLNVIGIPGTYNLRLQEQIPSFIQDVTPGETLEFQLSFSARIADSIGLLAAAAAIGETADTSENATKELIISGLQKYVGGGLIYRGWFDDWFFNADRAIAGDVLLAWKPALLTRHILAPDQFIWINDTLRQVPVFFTHMDMVQLNQVNDPEGSFYATFYLEITSIIPVDIARIDFTNAARSETSHEYLLDIKPISFRKIPGKKPLYNYMFRVSGKFLFEPDLKNYPFDKQKFPIQLQPANATNPFFIQPSTTALNDSLFETDGWHYRNQYVGYAHDIISYYNSFNDQQRNQPFYKFSYTYVMSRARVDFFLKVLTPLLVILVVTYFSVFIPLSRVETLEAIQVTSLLASIALYFSAYKPEMEHATISDKIFIFTYIMITSLIGTSILQFVKRKKYDTESKIAKIYQRYIYPAIILIITLFLVL